jgi:hypothetical protein
MRQSGLKEEKKMEMLILQNLNLSMNTGGELFELVESMQKTSNTLDVKFLIEHGFENLRPVKNCDGDYLSISDMFECRTNTLIVNTLKIEGINLDDYHSKLGNSLDVYEKDKIGLTEEEYKLRDAVYEILTAGATLSTIALRQYFRVSNTLQSQQCSNLSNERTKFVMDVLDEVRS